MVLSGGLGNNATITVIHSEDTMPLFGWPSVEYWTNTTTTTIVGATAPEPEPQPEPEPEPVPEP
jgi:hypothetical protein